jgi:heme-degrading monooxygenase HmoA
MIRAIYRWEVQPGAEEAFVNAWIRGTEVIREHVKGAQGSVLLRNRSKPVEFIAIARWESFADWQAFSDAKPPAPRAFQCVEEVSTLISAEVCDEIYDLVFDGSGVTYTRPHDLAAIL